jgi:hypothetical protein
MLQTAVMKKWIPSVVDAFGHEGMPCTSPIPVRLLRVPHEVLLVTLVMLASKLDDTTVLFRNHEGIFCNN